MKQLIKWTKKILCNGGLFIIILFLTYKTIFSNIDLKQLKDIILNTNLIYLLLGFITVIFMVCNESLVIKRNLRLLGENQKYKNCLVYAFAGNFFSGITPAATGGQPMQLYLMNKDKVPLSKGTLALLMDLCAYQISILVLAVVGYASFFEIINESLGSFIVILWVGIILNIIILFLTLIAIFSRKFVYVLVSLIVKMINIFNKKWATKFEESAMLGVANYKKCSEILKNNKKFYATNCCITFIRILAMHMAPFWVYKSFGLEGASIYKLISLQAVTYISYASVPLPGGIGVGESVFLLYFKSVFMFGTINSAMILSRGIGFYSVMIFCGISLLIYYLIKRVNK